MRLLYLFLLIGLIACSKDEDNSDTAIYVQSIAISGTNINLGITGQMTAIVLPQNATDKSILWEVSDSSIAEISNTGLLTAKKNGTVIVQATANDKGTVKSTKEITISSFASGPSYNYVVSTSSELLSALNNVKAGEIIFLNGGNYIINDKITLSKSGTSGNEITLIGQTEGTRAKLDFSAMSENSANRGVTITGNYWHIKGIDIFAAGDNGMFISGNNNLIEFCTFSENADTGLQIGNGAANNTILNCDSFFNADSSIENADGFACKLDAGTGNKFIGCRAWQNLDDGWDGYLRGTDNITTTYENCWAIKNGYLKNGTKGLGDGNGFKTGGSDDKLLRHNAIYKNCLAVGNVYDGFDHNSNRGNVTMYNCSAYDNGKNYSFSNTNPLEKLTIKNSSVLGILGSVSASNIDITNNSWQNGIVTTSEDFISIDYSELISARNADGSLPNITFFHLKAGSDLIDKGIDVGLSFNGSAPDLGPFESN
ncbi:right-handed parallel beta-helix repeat-containing protein [Lutibacter maritimus]|uniref:Right handed beta helix region n=1 Tax=Lutibacter maritimus TaxID=593133 RepID=A0A1I6R0T7_9FLAO|nr:Ig-like domain-containing protein [Lutibacter maritimus]SFS58316.1 Right handed beta helix region [Lutibacter maritimus]